MPSFFLDVLPREIRDQVYANYFTPTGRVTIRPNDSCDTDTPRLVTYPAVWPYTPIDMSLIRTCKQVYQECRGVFWQHNTVLLTTKFLVNPDFVNSLYTSWGQLRRLELKFGLSVDDIEGVRWVLQPLDALSRRGKLQEVLFTICGIGTMHKWGLAVTSRRNVVQKGFITAGDIYEVLGKAGHEKIGYLAHLKRSLDLRLGMEHVSAVARKEWFEKNPPKECEDAFGSLHHVLGGDCFMDGVLCYRDGVQIRDSFNLWDKDGEPVKRNAEAPKG